MKRKAFLILFICFVAFLMSFDSGLSILDKDCIVRTSDAKKWEICSHVIDQKYSVTSPDYCSVPFHSCGQADSCCDNWDQNMECKAVYYCLDA